MALCPLSLIISWPFLVYYAATLHVDPPSRKTGRGPEWVDENILASGKSAWVLRTKECQGNVLVASPRDAQPEERPAAIQAPQDEFSDLSPAEMAWVEEQYSTRESQSFPAIPPDTPDPADKPTHDVGGAQELPLTTGECKPAHGGYERGQSQLHTCRFRNVYASMGVLAAHVLETDSFPSGFEMVYTRCGAFAQSLRSVVQIYTHKSWGAFQAHMRSGNHTRFDGTTLAFEPKWHFNIGHALYDGLYPAFVSLVQWGMDRAPFRVLKLGPPNPERVERNVPGAFGRNEEVFGLIGGRGIVARHALGEDADKLHSLFETLVIGMGRNCQKLDMNGNFSLGGGRDLGAARLLRSRAYGSLGIPARAGGRPERPLRGIIINNRRWASKAWVEPVRSKAAAAGVGLEFVDWGKAPDAINKNGGSRQNPSPTSGQFRDHLLLVSRTHIHVSSPGTGMMYQQFLPDGAVHINLGETPGLPGLFMEEHMAEGAPYIRALYYWPARGDATDYDADRIAELVVQARELVQGGFEIPVPVNTNLSPTLRVVKAFMYLTQDEGKLRSLAPLRLYERSRSSPSYDVNYFNTHFPHEFLLPPPKQRGMKQQLNPCLLRALTRDYGEPCDKCEWGFP